MRSCRKSFGEATVREDLDERVGKGLRVAGLDEQAVLPVLHEVGNAADASSDDGSCAAESLDDDTPHPLRPRRQDERGGLVERP